ncbi:MAG: S8 family serine peptidase [Microvirga sp.]|nr:S8 family serine peptidase [Microvirga sp.]
MASGENRARPTRRNLLRGLGLGAGVAYAAPLLLPLSEARASGFSASFSGYPPRRARARPPAPPPEFVVSAPDDAALDRIAADGFEVLGRAPVAAIGAIAARLRAPAGRSLEEARARVAAIVPEAEIDLNHLYRPDEFPCGPEGCAAFAMIGWAASGGCPARPTIGMIDTGLNPDHAALADRDVEVVALDTDERPGSARMHGTAVAALLVGAPDTRTPGLLPDARLVAIDAFHAARGGDAADAFALVRALDLLVTRRVDVINMSFSGPSNALVSRLLAAAREAEIALVAAAGNDGPAAPPAYPAADPAVVAVTAIDARSRAFRQAASGEHVAFAAPGVRLWTAASISGGRLRSGTSYATPFVTAAIGAARVADPQASLDQIIERLARDAVDLGEPGRDPVFGHGLIDASGFCGAQSGATIFSTATE